MRKRSTRLIVSTYVLSLLVTISLLVVWVIYVVASVARIREVAGRVGFSNPNTHWVILAVGCSLFFLIIVGLTYQLALTLATRRYTRKQEEFVSNITHEMKSPLAAIKLHAQTLQAASLAAEERRSVDYILAQADRMGGLVDDVLESSRLLARKRSLTLEPIAVDRFFSSYLPTAAPRLEAQGIQLKAELSSNATVLAAAPALERVMDNLLDNAARFSHRGGEVRCRVFDRAPGVRIEVEDDGIGIPKGELPKIFDRFYQLSREIDGRRRGTGLGLSIVSGLVREMKGSVRAFSQEGRPGTRFVIELPGVPAP